MGPIDRGFLIRYSGIPGWSLPSMENLANVKLLYWSGKVAMDSVAHLPRKEMLVNDIAGSVGGNAFAVWSRTSLCLGTRSDAVLWLKQSIRLVRTTMDGASNETIEVSHIPVNITKAERDRAIQAQKERAFRRMLRDQLPEFKPTLVHIVPDGEGRL